MVQKIIQLFLMNNAKVSFASTGVGDSAPIDFLNLVTRETRKCNAENVNFYQRLRFKIEAI